MKVILTGFEPWADWQSNPSGDVAVSLDGEKVKGAEVVSVVLPVAYGDDTTMLFPLIERHKPAAIVSLGLGPTPVLNVERVAVNIKADDQPIVAGGPDAYFSTLPTRSIVEAITAGGVPARLSYHAGTFLCNHIMYSVLHYLTTTGQEIPAGFIHLPPTPELVAADGKITASMGLDKIREGTVIALENLVDLLNNT